MRTAAALALLAATSSALAQDGGKRGARDFENEIVREVERGIYLKANVGSTIYTSGFLAGVASTSVGVGSDFIDRERFSAAWEVQFQQGLFNGPKTDQLAPGIPLQGDVHTMAGLVFVEASTYVTRRLGLGVRGGGGVMVVPLLMEANAWQSAILPVLGTATVHDGPLPVVGGGPTVEYYTKLSHFSVGADVDFTFPIGPPGFGLGIAPSGYLKYTF